MSEPELASVPGIGPRHAARVVAALDLARRLLSEPLEHGKAITSDQDVFNAFEHRLRDLERETFLAVYLDVKNRVICDEIVAIGSVDSCAVSPCDILRSALRVAAVGLIVIHCHPSGDATPSSADDALTERLREATKLVGIQLLDHVIIGDGRHFSYAARGRVLRLGHTITASA